MFVRRTVLERPATEGNSPVNENAFVLFNLIILEYCPVRSLGRKQGALDKTRGAFAKAKRPVSSQG